MSGKRVSEAEVRAVEEDRENAMRYGVCPRCWRPRRRVIRHDGVLVEDPPTLEEARRIGGTWEMGVECECR